MVLIGTAAPALLGVQERFVFAGLSRRTTVEELRTRYPKSLIVGRQVYVAESDSHDHIYTIRIPEATSAGRLTVGFEKPGPRAQAYPRCDTVLGAVERQYGKPATLQEFDEERARNRRYIWLRGDETLSLLCFRIGQRPFSASELTIALREPE